jgi:putative intracellular protease/amidase
MANIAVALANDFEDSEFSVPCRRLTAAGHTLTVFGKHRGETITGKHHEVEVTVDRTAHTLYPDDYAALLSYGVCKGACL